MIARHGERLDSSFLEVIDLPLLEAVLELHRASREYRIQDLQRIYLKFQEHAGVVGRLDWYR